MRALLDKSIITLRARFFDTIMSDFSYSGSGITEYTLHHFTKEPNSSHSNYNQKTFPNERNFSYSEESTECYPVRSSEQKNSQNNVNVVQRKKRNAPFELPTVYSYYVLSFTSKVGGMSTTSKRVQLT